MITLHPAGDYAGRVVLLGTTDHGDATLRAQPFRLLSSSDIIL